MSGLDFTDEGLAEAANPVAETPVEEIAQEAPAVEAPVKQAEDDEPAGEELTTEDEVNPSEDFERRYEEAQKIIGRQGQELGDLRKRFEEFESRQQQVQAPEVPGIAPEQVNALIESADSNPQQAFQLALEHAPQAIPAVIAQIRLTHGDVLAEQAAAAYAEIRAEQRAMQVREEFESRVQPLQQDRESAQIAHQAQQVAAQFLETVDRAELDVILPDLQANMRATYEAMAGTVEQRGYAVTPVEAQMILQNSYYRARDAKSAEIQAAKRDAQAVDAAAKSAASAERGTPGQSQAAPAMSEAEQIAASVLSAGAALSARDLFNPSM